MKTLYCLFFFAVLCISSCTGQSFPLEESSNQPGVTQTAFTSPTKTPTLTPLVEAYPLKRVWIEYGTFAGYHTDFELTFPVTLPAWVLYTDGTLIQYQKNDDVPLKTKVLSKNEICDLFSKLEQLELYEVQSDGMDIANDPIYETRPSEKVDPGGVYEYITVNGNKPKSLYLYEPLKKYATQSVKYIMNSMGEYSPTGLQPYPIDRLGLFVQSGRPYESVKNLEPIPWPSYATPLLEKNELGSLYLEGEMAARVYSIFEKPYITLVFSNQGQEYTVKSRPLLPHESPPIYFDTPRGTAFDPPFGCK